MPSLTFTNSSTLCGGILNSRVLIGRRLSHGVVLEDPSVSRLHAWIDPVADETAEWVITDAGSKTGTFVNGHRVTRQPLHNCDIIRVGSATLTYHEHDTLPQGTRIVELSSPSGVVKTSGILFECACGAPLWVGNDLAGKRGMCRHCRQPVTVPSLAVTPPPTPQPHAVSEASVRAESPVENVQPPPVKQNIPEPTPASKSAKCAVCHSPILEVEERTQCPDCAMSFHKECWQENFGCSSYGCPQVNVLQPAMAVESPKVVADPVEAAPPEPPRTTPWEPILLGASVVCSLLGALLFGGLAAIVAILTLVILVKGSARKPALLIVAMVICLLGVVAGLGVSDFWYFNSKHIPSMLIRYL